MANLILHGFHLNKKKKAYMGQSQGKDVGIQRNKEEVREATQENWPVLWGNKGEQEGGILKILAWVPR